MLGPESLSTLACWVTLARLQGLCELRRSTSPHCTLEEEEHKLQRKGLFLAPSSGATPFQPLSTPPHKRGGVADPGEPGPLWSHGVLWPQDQHAGWCAPRLSRLRGEAWLPGEPLSPSLGCCTGRCAQGPASLLSAGEPLCTLAQGLDLEGKWSVGEEAYSSLQPKFDCFSPGFTGKFCSQGGSSRQLLVPDSCPGN